MGALPPPGALITLPPTIPRQPSGPGPTPAHHKPHFPARARLWPCLAPPASTLTAMNTAHTAARPVAACAAPALSARRPAAPSALLAAPAPCRTPCCFRKAALQPAWAASGARRRAAAAAPRAEQQGGSGEVKVSRRWLGQLKGIHADLAAAPGLQGRRLHWFSSKMQAAWVPAHAPLHSSTTMCCSKACLHRCPCCCSVTPSLDTAART